jgi:hypothetical protein
VRRRSTVLASVCQKGSLTVLHVHDDCEGRAGYCGHHSENLPRGQPTQSSSEAASPTWRHFLYPSGGENARSVSQPGVAKSDVPGSSAGRSEHPVLPNLTFQAQARGRSAWIEE